mmetsp:Transcript_117004/g.372398  ORF Transcript_117004/g.372398 Transcript_117004/m.372398 type:complete len:1146 (-) Transcript_117004:98-3535(-)
MDLKTTNLVRKLLVDLDSGSRRNISNATVARMCAVEGADLFKGVLRRLGYALMSNDSWTLAGNVDQREMEQIYKELRLDHVQRGIPVGDLLNWWMATAPTKEETMWQFVNRVVKPGYANKYNASVAEVEFGDKVGPVDIFLNHSWQTPLADTMESLRRLLKSRGWQEQMRVFICSFVLNQRPDQVHIELGDSIDKSPFARVLDDMGSRGCGNFITNVQQTGELFKRGWVVLADSKALTYGMEIIFMTSHGELNNGNAPPESYAQLFDAVKNFSVNSIECTNGEDKNLILEALKEDWSKKGGVRAFERSLKAKYRKAIEQAIQQLSNIIPSLSSDRVWIPRESISAWANGNNKDKDDKNNDDIIGSGSSGRVYKAFYGQVLVAAKVYHASFRELEENKEKWESELRLAMRLRHPSIVQVFGLALFNGGVALIQELCEGQTLKAYLKNKDKQEILKTSVDDIARKSLLARLAAAISYMHGRDVAHRDIKSDNIFVVSENNLKLMDFGAARLDNSFATMITSTATGTCAWCAPEVLSGEEHNLDGLAADVYSFGVVAFEVVTFELPWDNLKVAALTTAVLIKQQTPAQYKKCSEVGVVNQTMHRCLTFEAHKRPKMPDVLKYLSGKSEFLLVTEDEGQSIHQPQHVQQPDPLLEPPKPLIQPSSSTTASGANGLAAVRLLTTQRVPPDSSPTPWSDSATPAPTLSGCVSAASAVVGARVGRGGDWMWAEQDDEGSLGQIVEVVTETQWVRVQWSSGHTNWYRAGSGTRHDLTYPSPYAVEAAARSLEEALRTHRVKQQHLKRTFGYGAGVQHAHFSRFDIRDEICKELGGFTHGTRVRLQHGGGVQMAVTIGVKCDNDAAPKLWFHCDNAEAAGIFERADLPKLKEIGTQIMKEHRRDDFEAASDDETDNRILIEVTSPSHFSFRYPMGRLGIKPTLFDVRDDACKKLGHFVHGEVVRFSHRGVSEKFTVIGIQLKDDGLPALFVHKDGDEGAGTFPSNHWAIFRPYMQVVDKVKVHEMSPEDATAGQKTFCDLERLCELSPSLKLNFRYPLGLGPCVQAGLFDIRDEVCLVVGGFVHGQLVEAAGGHRATVIGVRLGQEGLPELFFHSDGAPGAGIFPQYGHLQSKFKDVGFRAPKELTEEEAKHLE